MRKQMEGDNQRRRALARQARERGHQPSRDAATLGASKQLTHLDRGSRAGPAPAGVHKPDSTRGGPQPPPTGTPANPRPGPRPGPGQPESIGRGYRELVTDISRRTGVDFREAKVGAEATVLVLARALPPEDRQRLLRAVPMSLHDVTPIDGIEQHHDLAGFLAEVARISGRTPEQARYQAQATVAALADQDLRLVTSLRLPPGLADLLAPPQPGGGLVGPSGSTAPLTAAELRAALAELPYWSVRGPTLVRSVALPPANLDRVLARIDQLREDTGRGPAVTRQTAASAVLTVHSRQADAITARDIDLAHLIDDVIEEAGAGMAG